MEHRPLTDREIIERCCLNLTETYFALARAASTFRTFEDDGIAGGASNHAHPASNISFIGRPTLQSLQRLHARCEANGNMVSYVLPTDQIDAVTEMMRHVGFGIGNRLNLMFRPAHQDTPQVAVFPIIHPAERYELNQFLARQFFDPKETEFIQGISRLTALATRCNLVSLSPNPQNTQGGAMTFFTDDVKGLYNIAIGSEFRHRGLGQKLVQALSVNDASRFITLQAKDELVPWYETLGFRRYGEVWIARALSSPDLS